MKGEAVVVVVLREVDEVVDGLGGHLGIHESDREIPSRGVDRRGVFLGRVDDCGWWSGALIHAGDDSIVAARGSRGRRRGVGACAEGYVGKLGRECTSQEM